MEETVVSKKIRLGKKFRLLWILLAIILIAVSLMSYFKYSSYQEAQEAAVTFTLATTDRFDKYMDDYDELVEEMYDFFNPYHYNVEINGIEIDNGDVVSTAHDADRSLGKLMNEAGYDCYNGSRYLEYIGFFDFAIHNGQIKLCLTIWAALAVLLLLANLWYAADRKKQLVFDGDTIVCRKKEKVVKQFMVNDVKSVGTAGIKGLKVLGNGIKYKVNLVENRDEIKTAIMNKLAALSVQNTNVVHQENSADMILKYKELLDSGVISQEEFDAKKKQLLGL